MSLSDLASLGSFVSGIAVLASLIYLGLQVRQAERNQRALMQQGRSAQQVDLLLRIAEPSLSLNRFRFWACDPSMNDQEIDAGIYQSLAHWRTFEDGFLQHRAGTIDEASFVSDTAVISFILTYPAQRATWRLIRERFAPEFRDFVDGIQRQTRTAQPPVEAEAWRRYVSEEKAASTPS